MLSRQKLVLDLVRLSLLSFFFIGSRRRFFSIPLTPLTGKGPMMGTLRVMVMFRILVPAVATPLRRVFLWHRDPRFALALSEHKSAGLGEM